ncbi:glycoside hydrolase family 16 protein [Nocardioides bigeumensis]
MHLRSRAARTTAGLASAALLVTALTGLSASSGAAPEATPVTSTGETTQTTRVAGQRAAITMLPQISQPGRGTSSPARAKSVVAVKVSPRTNGRPVTLERLSGSRWVSTQKARLNKRGLADFAVATTSGGLPITYRAVVKKFRGKAAIKTSPVVSTEWGAADFADTFSGRRLGPAWTDRFGDYNPAGLRRCSKGSSKAVKVRGGAVRLSVLVDKSKGGKRCTARRADGSSAGRFKYRLNGHISTQHRVTLRYGVAAARMKFQKSKGQHASFWMQPNQPTGAANARKGGAEIDVIEWFGHPSKNGGMTSFIYYPTKRGPKKSGDFIKNPQQYLSSRSDTWWGKYHVFSVEWTPHAYIFRIDGQETWRTSKGVSGIAQYPILSLLSSDYELPNLGGDRRLPQHMYVDWLQMWQADSPL